MTKLTWTIALLVAVFALAGCSSWFQPRVDRLDMQIAAARLELEEAETPEDRATLEQRIAELKTEREMALGGALQESANKQALLMALISLGAGGLKVAGGMAAKGAGA